MTEIISGVFLVKAKTSILIDDNDGFADFDDQQWVIIDDNEVLLGFYEIVSRFNTYRFTCITSNGILCIGNSFLADDFNYYFKKIA